MSKKFRWPSPVEAEMHITSELGRAGITCKSGGRNNLKICCPFPHDKEPDVKFKLEILRNGRKAHCWVCNWAGSWNKLAHQLGLDPFGSEPFETKTFTKEVANIDMFGKLLGDIEDSVEEISSNTLPSGMSLWRKGEWRGFPPEFLSSLPSYYWPQWTKEGTIPRILWPYYQYGALVGYVGRRLDYVDETKYYRSPWSKALTTFFPFDYVTDHFSTHPSIVLVEGEVDALRLLERGIPALSILGTNNWSDSKRDMILSLGKKVFILMDGDFSGRKASSAIKESLQGLANFKVISLHEGEDPGDMSPDQISWLHRRVST